MTTETRQQATQDHTEERRGQILRAAVTCFARRGLHLTTMHDISAEAKISVGLIYRYFENKDAVITFMASEHMEEIRRILEQARGAPTLFEGLSLISACHCEEQPHRMQIALVADLYAESARNERVRALVHEVTRLFIDSLSELIAASDEARSAPDGFDPRVAAELIVDSMRGMMIRSITDSRTLSESEIRDRQLAMLRTIWPVLFSTAAPRRALRKDPV